MFNCIIRKNNSDLEIDFLQEREGEGHCFQLNVRDDNLKKLKSGKMNENKTNK